VVHFQFVQKQYKDTEQQHKDTEQQYKDNKEKQRDSEKPYKDNEEHHKDLSYDSNPREIESGTSTGPPSISGTIQTSVRSESRCALSLQYVDLVVSIEVAVEVCLMS
jgi:chromosome segregation ATPase